MTGVWVTIAALALATAALKLAGPLALGGRPMPANVLNVVELLASALLAALVVVETFGKGRSLTLDAQVVVPDAEEEQHEEWDEHDDDPGPLEEFGGGDDQGNEQQHRPS